MSFTRGSYGWVLIVVAAILWGSDYILRSPLTAAHLAPSLIVLGEHVMLTLLCLPALLRSRGEFAQLGGGDWLLLLLISWGGSALATWLYTEAFALGSPLLAVLLQKTQPFFALALAGIFLKERRQPLFWLLMAVAFFGGYLLTFGWMNPLTAAHSLALRAAALAVGASAFWGAATVAGQPLSQKLPPVALAGARFTLAVPPLLTLTLCSPGAFGTVRHLTGHLAVSWALVALLPGLLGMSLYYLGLKTTTASIATLAELAYPATALILGAFLQHTQLNVAQWLGFVILLASLQAVEWTRSVRAAKTVQAPVYP